MTAAGEDEGGGASAVFRRRVFYVSGFDPYGARRYRELYRREGLRQAAIQGYALDVEGLAHGAGEPVRWRATYAGPDGAGESLIEFLGWDDIVRAAARPGLLHVYRVMLWTLALYLSSGAIRAMWRLGRGPLIAGLVPAAAMVFYVVYAALAGWAAALVVAGPLGLPGWPAALTGLAAAAGLMAATRMLEEQAMVYFMVNDLGHMAGARGAWPAALDARIDVFADRIAVAMAEGWDEVLVVGHSSGAQIAVSALARAAQRGRPAGALGLLTLGQAIAMTSFLPAAAVLRADLVRLADDPGLAWIDVTAPGDGAAFALTDPVAAIRARGRPRGTPNPLIVSAAFTQTLSPARLRSLRYRLLRLHFQYLCAFDRPGAYDYFAITAGPQTLAQRFANRPASPSARAVPVAPFLAEG